MPAGSTGSERSRAKQPSIAGAEAGRSPAHAAASSDCSGDGRYSCGRHRGRSGTRASDHGRQAEDRQPRQRRALGSHELLESAHSVERWLAQSSTGTWSEPTKTESEPAKTGKERNVGQSSSPMASIVKACVQGCTAASGPAVAMRSLPGDGSAEPVAVARAG